MPVARRLRSEDVLTALAELFVTDGPLAHMRSDNGPEFIANLVQAVAGEDRREDALHYAGQPMVKWLLLEL